MQRQKNGHIQLIKNGNTDKYMYTAKIPILKL